MGGSRMAFPWLGNSAPTIDYGTKVKLSDSTTFHVPAGCRWKCVHHEDGSIDYYVGKPKDLAKIDGNWGG